MICITIRPWGAFKLADGLGLSVDVFRVVFVDAPKERKRQSKGQGKPARKP